MQKLLTSAWLTFILFALPGICFGQVTVKAQGSAPTTGFLGGAKPEDVGIATRKALLNALEQYAVKMGQTYANAFYRKDMDRLDPSEYILDYEVLAEENDKGAKVVVVYLNVRVNKAKIEFLLQEASSVNVTDGTGTSSVESPRIAFIIIGKREVRSEKADDRISGVNKVFTAGSEKENTAGRRGGVESDHYAESLEGFESGGKTVSTATAREYAYVDVREADAAFMEVLTAAGFEAVAGENIYLPYEDYAQDMEDKGFEFRKVDRNIRKEIDNICREEGMSFVAFLTISLEKTIPDRTVPGLFLATATAQAECNNLKRKTTLAASSDPAVMRGNSEKEAEVAAMQEACRQAGQKLVDQLRNAEVGSR